MSKGVIVLADTQSSSEAKLRHEFSITVDDRIAQLLSPSARVIVWCATSTGEILSDSLEVSVNAAFANEVTLLFYNNNVSDFNSNSNYNNNNNSNSNIGFNSRICKAHNRPIYAISLSGRSTEIDILCHLEYLISHFGNCMS